ncbi:hypothetical protein DXG03_006389 [Asterophora parasitica]|uniref:Uncharacterized protein n=1 Tax=Asterophora parasitica TaxID=117018 RepID=A0A9P7K779_9AGAR|nr:hypothetical protein DXG03_006389 [Asterophora parasitica]
MAHGRPFADDAPHMAGWDTAGFNNARSWLADVREHADPHLTCILVGNKIDLCEPASPAPPYEAPSSTSFSSTPTPTPSSASGVRKREVSTEEAQQWALEEGMLFVEASAKSGQNVEEAFVQAAADILGKIRRGVFDDNRSPGVKLSKPNSDMTLEQGRTEQTCCGS